MSYWMISSPMTGSSLSRALSVWRRLKSLSVIVRINLIAESNDTYCPGTYI